MVCSNTWPIIDAVGKTGVCGGQGGELGLEIASDGVGDLVAVEPVPGDEATLAKLACRITSGPPS